MSVSFIFTGEFTELNELVLLSCSDTWNGVQRKRVFVLHFLYRHASCVDINLHFLQPDTYFISFWCKRPLVSLFATHLVYERALSCNKDQIWALKSKVWLCESRGHMLHVCHISIFYVLFCCDLIDRYVEVAVAVQSVRCHASHWTAQYSTNYLVSIGIFPEDHTFASCWSSSDSPAICLPFILLWCY